MSGVAPDPPAAALTFFVDRGLGKAMAEALRAAGETVVHSDDLFPQDVEDVTWLLHVGNEGWVALTKDKRILRRAEERPALERCRVRLFCLANGNLRGDRQIAPVHGALPEVRRLVALHEPPLIGVLPLQPAGAIRIVLPAPSSP